VIATGAALLFRLGSVPLHEARAATETTAMRKPL